MEASARPQRDSEEFSSEVRGMFDRISGVYDLMNSAMTAGLHHQWRQRAVDRAQVGPGADALDLPYGDDGFDAVTIGFGARNLADLDKGLGEMARVLRPGGRVVILEITRPTREPLSSFNSLWFDRQVPLLGQAAGDADAYSYLPESVRTFPQPRELADKMDAAGFTDIRWLLLAGGIIAIHSGTLGRS
jgi:demethylmenaquinone methyltransferase/2-methoxy-6-polyprenyl-1,4-benzoquinol methylase